MSSKLVNDMIEQHGYPLLTAESLDGFLASHEDVVLFFTENPEHFPESNDVAVILPELVRHFGGRLAAAVIDRVSERELLKRYNFSGWPSLVFLRRGEYLGVISRVQDWQVYISDIEAMLAAGPRPTPHVQVPIVAEAMQPSQAGGREAL